MTSGFMNSRYLGLEVELESQPFVWQCSAQPDISRMYSFSIEPSLCSKEPEIWSSQVVISVLMSIQVPFKVRTHN